MFRRSEPEAYDRQISAGGEGVVTFFAYRTAGCTQNEALGRFVICQLNDNIGSALAGKYVARHVSAGREPLGKSESRRDGRGNGHRMLFQNGRQFLVEAVPLVMCR